MTALRFEMEMSQTNHGDYFYRVELADGREALVRADSLTVTDSGALIAIWQWEANEISDAHEYPALVLAPGTWVSAYIVDQFGNRAPAAIAELAESRSDVRF
jgi:hypothetical protein